MSKFQVYVTRRIPETGLGLLREGGCDVSLWYSDEAVPQGELLRGVEGKDALLCMLTDQIDKDVIDKAGKFKVSRQKLI